MGIHLNDFLGFIAMQLGDFLIVKIKDVLRNVAGHLRVFVVNGDGNGLVWCLADPDLVMILEHHVGLGELVVALNTIVGPEVVFLNDGVGNRL